MGADPHPARAVEAERRIIEPGEPVLELERDLGGGGRARGDRVERVAPAVAALDLAVMRVEHLGDDAASPRPRRPAARFRSASRSP